MPKSPTSSVRRLTKRAQFVKAARGRKIAGRGFVLQALKVADETPGVGYTVTKKMGNAPERNRIKRRLRAAVAACGEKLVPGHDYVVIGRRACLSEPFEALVDGLGTAMLRVHGPRPPRTEANPLRTEAKT